MGLTIATSIMLAFAFGPLLVGSLGISGLFWLTSGFAILAMLLLVVVPTPMRVLKHNLDNKTIGQQLATVLKIGDL
ncbi:hypothetical protein SB772_44180, partial [Paraburkholderia sp. SIMBA_030]